MHYKESPDKTVIKNLHKVVSKMLAYNVGVYILSILWTF